MRVLVTGAAGFIGSHLVNCLLNRGYYVYGLDNLYSGNINNLPLDNNNFEFIVEDVRNNLNFEVSSIFNFACPASPTIYQKDPIYTFTTSIIGTLKIIELARKTCCKIIHASTSEVYGNPEEHPQKESYWGNVNPIGIRSCYDCGKRGTETLLTDAKRMYGVDARIIRIFNTYGPKMAINDGRVVTNFIYQALNNEPLTIFGDGYQTRSFCYIDDLVDGIMKIFELYDLDGPINLGNTEEYNILEIASKIIELTNSKSNIVYKSLPADDPKQRKPDIGKAKKLIQFCPKINLKEGLKRTINYIKELDEFKNR